MWVNIYDIILTPTAEVCIHMYYVWGVKRLELKTNEIWLTQKLSKQAALFKLLGHLTTLTTTIPPDPVASWKNKFINKWMKMTKIYIQNVSFLCFVKPQIKPKAHKDWNWMEYDNI